MKSLLCIIVLTLATTEVAADVVLTFDPAVSGNGTAMPQSYGDRVTESVDSNGHSYNIIPGLGYGLTPNVELAYADENGERLTMWTTGFSDLTNVLNNEDDGETLLQVTLTADPGFEVGLIGFDMGTFSSGMQTVPGMVIHDGQGTTFLSPSNFILDSTTSTHFDFSSGLFAQQLIIDVDLTSLGTSSDNVGIDNLHFSQRTTAVPEPSCAIFGCLLVGVLGFQRCRARLN